MTPQRYRFCDIAGGKLQFPRITAPRKTAIAGGGRKRRRKRRLGAGWRVVACLAVRHYPGKDGHRARSPWERRTVTRHANKQTACWDAGAPALSSTSLFISEKVPPSPFFLFLGSGGRSVWKLHLGDGGDKGMGGKGGMGGTWGRGASRGGAERRGGRFNCSVKSGR